MGRYYVVALCACVASLVLHRNRSCGRSANLCFATELTSSQLTERSDLEIPGLKVGEPELAGSPVAQRAMWPKLIVILSPTFDLVTGVIQ